VLGDCPYCDEPLTTERQSVTCDHCGDGFHVACAESARELTVEERSHLLRSNTYAVDCPQCGGTWEVGFDPRP